jgi:type II secretory pathway predicted ATPase ExeA
MTLQKLTPQEQQLFARYGKLPTHKSVLMKMQKVRPKFDVVIVVLHVPSRSGNTLILAIMLSLRQVLPLRIRSALRFPTQKSQCSKNPVSDKLQ